MNQLEALKSMTTVVADTGDIEAIKRSRALEATTNPSLVTAELKKPERQSMLLDAIKNHETVEDAMDFLSVSLGAEILNCVDGRVSTEVKASASYSTKDTLEHAYKLIGFYKELGVDPDRVLIKIAATWEGIQAAKELESKGIHCNLTLIFGMHQALACANAGVTLISPFVGRITDWQKKQAGLLSVDVQHDSGVNSVKSIYNLYKSSGVSTQVMGASFRSTEQILALAGCDLLTIAPKFLSELEQSMESVTRQLSPADGETMNPEVLTEATFKDMHAKDACASELLDAGIKGFEAAYAELHQALSELKAS